MPGGLAWCFHTHYLASVVLEEGPGGTWRSPRRWHLGSALSAGHREVCAAWRTCQLDPRVRCWLGWSQGAERNQWREESGHPKCRTPDHSFLLLQGQLDQSPSFPKGSGTWVLLFSEGVGGSEGPQYSEALVCRKPSSMGTKWLYPCDLRDGHITWPVF